MIHSIDAEGCDKRMWHDTVVRKANEIGVMMLKKINMMRLKDS